MKSMSIDADTALFVSISQRPSTNGVYFYNGLFSRMAINAVYLSAPTNNLGNLCQSLTLLGVKGAAIAAPFKLEIVDHLHELTEVAKETLSVNCIRKSPEGHWIGHNTDEVGLREVFSKWQVGGVCKHPTVVIYGSGGVVPSVISALRGAIPGCRLKIQARNSQRVLDLATRYSIEPAPIGEAVKADLFINATPLYEQEIESLIYLSSKTDAVFDLNPIQQLNLFESLCGERGKRFLRGFDLYIEQLAAQFAFFTGKVLDRTILNDLVISRSDLSQTNKS